MPKEFLLASFDIYSYIIILHISHTSRQHSWAHLISILILLLNIVWEVLRALPDLLDNVRPRGTFTRENIR